MPMTKSKGASLQPELFEEDERHVLPVLPQRERLMALIEVLLLEIATALARGEARDEQDHG